MAAAAVLLPLSARAQNSDTAPSDIQSRPHMMSEGAGITDVIDAFDAGSIWAARISVGYLYSVENATLQRERSALTGSGTLAPAGVTPFDDVAHYWHTRQTLDIGAHIALWHDLAFTFGLPVILADQSNFDAASSVSTGDALNRLQDGYAIDGMATSLFPQTYTPGTNGGAGTLGAAQLPFRSPNRSGIDQIRLGFSWDILNQRRDPHLPTWLVRFEWRIPVGAPMRPCYQDAGGHSVCPDINAPRPGACYVDSAGLTQCPGAPTDETTSMYSPAGSNNLVPNAQSPAFNRASVNSPGISRGVHSLYLQTVMSRRIGYLEPYVGLDFLAEIPASGDDQNFRFANTPFGQLATYPPLRGSLMAGTEIVPWENRETWQRFVVDLSVRALYASQGRDFTGLFDALGSSNSVPLTQPNYSISDQMNGLTTRPVGFSGTTGVESHGEFTAHASVRIQAAKFLSFSLLGSITYITPYLITATDACNPAVTPENDGQHGGCIGNAVPDPQNRPVIDAPGNRFRFTDDIVWNLFVNVALTPRF